MKKASVSDEMVIFLKALQAKHKLMGTDVRLNYWKAACEKLNIHTLQDLLLKEDRVKNLAVSLKPKDHVEKLMDKYHKSDFAYHRKVCVQKFINLYKKTWGWDHSPEHIDKLFREKNLAALREIERGAQMMRALA